MKFSVLNLCKEAMKLTTKEPCWDWLYVLPLCHFMSGACEPYASLEYNPENIRFNARAIQFGYNDLRQRITPGYVCISIHKCYIGVYQLFLV